MASMALSRAKAGADARLNEEKKHAEKKRNIIVLATRYFQDLGYINTVQQIQNETGISLNKIDAADNIDLGNILTEYEDFYEMRFGRRPKIVRKVDGGGEEKKEKPRQCSLPQLNAHQESPENKRGSANRSKSEGRPQRRDRPPSMPDDEAKTSAATPGYPGDAGAGDGLGVAGQNVAKASSSSSKKEPKAGAPDVQEPKPGDDFYGNQLRRALPSYGADKEYRDLALTISRDILSRNPGVRWSSIVGLNHAKALLKEAVVMPLKYPQLFTGLLAPWKGVLLFGPPGTGKTLLAKAVATECETTFFNISASTVVSKWRGDSEKLIKVLFDLARHHQPSTIFIDELDSIMSARGENSEHEGSRRMKTELLIQMDGLSGDSSDQVFVLAASNLPWDLDGAMLRRLEKRILVTLPTAEAREAMLRLHLPEGAVEEINYSRLASMTEEWSGSDIRLLCKEAAMHPLRRLMADIERAEIEAEDKAQNRPHRRSAAERAAQKASEKGEPAPICELKVGLVTEADVTRALETVHRAPGAHLDRYQEWQDQFGAA